jgi:hypothetical protein
MTPKFLLVIFVLTLALESTQGYSQGAPSSPEVCKGMTPGHVRTAPQKGTHPFSVELESTEVRGGDKLRIKIQEGPKIPFKGFLLMGQRLNKSGLPEETGIPHGFFSPSQNSQTVNCGGKDGAVTHVNGDPKHEVTLEWTAPNEDGEYVILYSIVKDYSTYWVKQKTQPIRVKKDWQSEDGTHDNQGTDLDESAEKIIQEYASGCGKTKGCFGLPEGCLQKSASTCEMFTTFRSDGSRFLFQIAGKLPTMPENMGHVSVGLSFDQKMGQDSVTGCVMKDRYIQVKSYYNYLTKPGDPIHAQNSIMRNQTAGLDKGISTQQPEGKYVGGVLFCEFARTPFLDSPYEIQKTFDLNKDNYYILLARAPEISSKGEFGEKLGYHPKPEDRGSSSTTFSLKESKIGGPGIARPGEKPKGKGKGFNLVSSSILIIGLGFGNLMF